MDCGELNELIQREIPDGRNNLDGSYANLEKVAAYCEANYLQAVDKQSALEETRRFTVQSLASVAYQVNTLASNLLRMLDLQADNIENMESNIAAISQHVDIHKEKVARREIGLLTTNKLTQRQHKIVTPVHQEKAQRYTRPPIDYSILDELGHGVRVHNAGDRLVGRTASTVSGASSGSTGSQQVHMRPPLDNAWPMHNQQPASVSRASARDYRTNVPSALDTSAEYMQYAGMQYNQGASVNRASSMSSAHSSSANYSHVSVNSRASHGIEPYMPQQQQYNRMTIQEDPLPPPPSPGMMDSYPESHSPPLPPPPDQQATPMALYNSKMNSVPDWVPQIYLEKVVAVYDYAAEKEDELSFQENSVIYVLRKNEDGWFEGVFEGVTGLFPGNYVEPCM